MPGFMDRNNMVRRMIFCAALLGLVSPLRAGEAAWRHSPDNLHAIQLPADWLEVPAVPGLSPRGMTHAFSMAPGSRAFVLDIAAVNELEEGAVQAAGHFAKARKRAGNPPARNLQLADGSQFKYFKSARTVNGRAVYRLEGALTKYLIEYYLVFSSTRSYPAGKDWKEALGALVSMELDDPSVDSWKEDFDKKVAGGEGNDAGAAGGSLKDTAATREDGTPVPFEEIVVFACANFDANRYLFNKDRTDHCWIATLEDFRAILLKLGGRYYAENTVTFEHCPAAMRQEKICEPKQLRNF